MLCKSFWMSDWKTHFCVLASGHKDKHRSREAEWPEGSRTVVKLKLVSDPREPHDYHHSTVTRYYDDLPEPAVFTDCYECGMTWEHGKEVEC